MNRTIFALIAAGLVGFGMQALADDTSADQQKTAQKQFMKDCMENARASHNGMSEEDMKKACMDQWKSSMGNPDKPITPAH
jgi:Na+-translocating ferredoxin:NAD+ oxidoreductase RnfG subunit